MKTTMIPRLTAGVHTNARGSAFGEPVILDRLFPRGRPRLWHMLICLAGALVIGIAVMLAVILHRGMNPSAGNPNDPGDPGDGRQPGGIPSTETSEPGDDGERTLPNDDGETTRDPSTDHSRETDEEPSEGTTPSGTESESEPSDPNSPGGDTDTSEGGEDTADGTEPADPADSSAPPEEGTEPEDDSEEESRPNEDPHPETDEGDESQSDAPSVAVPEGCYPIESVDMSESQRGAGYITGEAEMLPGSLPEGGLWGSRTPPTILIINTHPYEAYGDGKAWYDPSAGGLALADTPSDVDGTVALAASLGRTLRGMGVTVMHLRIAVSAEDSAADVYARTETVVRSYCRLYPDIGLVLDLRRSAELTPSGGILRTEGTWEGEACAQIRISVSGDREEAATGRDLAVALALRRELWLSEPTISRPVRVKTGGGMAGDLSDVCVLTLDVGAAGNVYSEAAPLMAPLADALGRVVEDGT